MKGYITIRCYGCGKILLSGLLMDTADMPEQLQEKINKALLSHRKACRFYRSRDEMPAGEASIEF